MASSSNGIGHGAFNPVMLGSTPADAPIYDSDISVSRAEILRIKGLLLNLCDSL